MKQTLKELDKYLQKCVDNKSIRSYFIDLDSYDAKEEQVDVIICLDPLVQSIDMIEPTISIKYNNVED
jgi:hypothetical protein